MNKCVSKQIQELIQEINFKYISYVGCQTNETENYPDGFLEGYHKCIEDLMFTAENFQCSTKPND
jgi:hypothetical protein